MSPTKPARPRLAFLLDHDTSEGSHGTPSYFHIRARLLQLTDDGELHGLLDFPRYDGLEVDCQASPGDHHHVQGGTYGWATEFKPHRVDLARARAMAATLAKVERFMERRRYPDEYPDDFAGYLRQVAGVLGVRAFRYWVRKPRHLLDDGELGMLDGEELAAWCDERTTEFHRTHPTEAAS
jgi:hypothetical protein